MASLQGNIIRAATGIREANALLVCAGAGMGVDSGLPDFRGPEGLWKAYPPLKERGLTLPEVSTPHWFESDPVFAWGFFGHRRNLYNSTTPHDGFSILKRWGEAMPGGYFVNTSNIDGHFQCAGFAEEQVAECHGCLQFMQCCGTQHVDCAKLDHLWSSADVKVEVDEATLQAKKPLPSCPGCGGMARPNVLMFDDDTWVASRTDSQERRLHTFLDRVRSSGQPYVVIEIGAGLAVPTIRMASEHAVGGKRQGTLIRINPREPEVPDARHISLATGGLHALTSIDEYMVPPAVKSTDPEC